MPGQRVKAQALRKLCARILLFLAVYASSGCARLPYTTKVIHEDRRAEVKLQQEVSAVGYTHPVRLSASDVAAILRGFSLREKTSMRLRWFGEEAPPKSVFREDEIAAVASHVAAGLSSAGTEERVHFALFAPGMNPASERDTTAGWLAVREPYLFLQVEHYHAQFPLRKEEEWDLRYPALPPEPGNYSLYFEPGRFWVTDPASGQSAVQLREFLKSAIVPLKK